jgi:hypothetical protein
VAYPHIESEPLYPTYDTCTSVAYVRTSRLTMSYVHLFHVQSTTIPPHTCMPSFVNFCSARIAAEECRHSYIKMCCNKKLQILVSRHVTAIIMLSWCLVYCLPLNMLLHAEIISGSLLLETALSTIVASHTCSVDT